VYAVDIRLDGKRALVTGGNSGIGRAVAIMLGQAGAAVAVNYVDRPEAAEEVATAIRSDGGQAMAVLADVSDRSQVRRMFAQVDAAIGSVDILVNNAGIDGPRALSWTADPEAWRRVIDVNLLGTFYCSREALARMIPRRQGVVITITSVHDRIPWGGYSGYAASKAALAMLTRTLAQEAAPHGVRVLAVAPGAIQTPINEAVWDDTHALADLLRKIPLGRLGQPEEVARIVTVLASDVGAYITGATVLIDGGMSLYASFAHGG
jgi:NAD(P)-dependent dehydrogenase (short-subunit alcohol dehydrogenase family)